MVVDGRVAHRINSKLARVCGQLSGMGAGFCRKEGTVLCGVGDKGNSKSYSLGEQQCAGEQW